MPLQNHSCPLYGQIREVVKNVACHLKERTKAFKLNYYSLNRPTSGVNKALHEVHMNAHRKMVIVLETIWFPVDLYTPLIKKNKGSPPLEVILLPRTNGMLQLQLTDENELYVVCTTLRFLQGQIRYNLCLFKANIRFL